MNYSALNKCDVANGPGVRVSLFVSGCRRGCKGCFNREAWDFSYGQKFTEETFDELEEALVNPNVAGLSILGGDPFEPENRECVANLCALVSLYHPKKSIWMWTGYTYEDVKNAPAMKYIDVLVDGPFVEELKDLRLPWCGSSNQRVIDVQESLRKGEVVLWEEQT
jgi:anaerobic ribonucleoside-triphosphate reductase activating protein